MWKRCNKQDFALVNNLPPTAKVLFSYVEQRPPTVSYEKHSIRHATAELASTGSTTAPYQTVKSFSCTIGFDNASDLSLLLHFIIRYWQYTTNGSTCCAAFNAISNAALHLRTERSAIAAKHSLRRTLIKLQVQRRKVKSTNVFYSYL